MALMAVGVLVCARPTVASLQIGLALAVAGECWRLWALGYSGEHTRSTEISAPTLITAGPFARCRNPLYVGNTANSLGVAVAATGGWPWLSALAIVLGCLATLTMVYGCCIVAEEKFLRQKFGEEYREYCVRMARFSPFHSAHPSNNQGKFSFANLRFEKMTLVWWVLIWVYLWWRAC